MNRRTTQKEQTYWNVFIKFMSYIDNNEYHSNEEFSEEKLLSITPEMVYKYLAYRGYGIEEPNSASNPIHRDSTVAFDKKAISYFLPDKDAQWNSHNRSGNPTKSSKVNSLLTMMKKAQVSKRGIKSQATRALELSEWLLQSDLLCESPVLDDKVLIRPLTVFNWALINRISDAIEFFRDEIKSSPQYDGVLLAKLRWSKNVSDERDCPNQVLLGSYESAFCVILALAIRLEYFIGTTEGRHSPFVFMPKIPDEVSLENNPHDDKPLQRYLSKIKNAVRRRLSAAVFKNPRWLSARRGHLGTHSLKKAPMTYAMRNGNMTRDNCDARGRFKNDNAGKKRSSDRYIETDLPWPDVKVANALCVGGAIKYSLDDGYGISYDWIVEHVVPNIMLVYPREVAIILGSALLWACFLCPML